MSKFRKKLQPGDKVYWLIKNQPNSTGVITKVIYTEIPTLCIKRSDGVNIRIAANRVHLIP